LGLSIAPIAESLPAGREDWAALWFAREPSARLVVTRTLRVLASNRKANELFERAGGLLALRDGFLTSRDRRLSGELAAMVSSASAAGALRALADGEGAAVLAEAMALDTDRAGAVGLAFRDLSAPAEIECADLEQLFGVTPGEHMVLVQLLKGRSSREIAEATGKSVLTVRTHVKRAYGKISVKTRGQLFARLLPYLSIR